VARLNPIRAELVVLGSLFGLCGVAVRAGVPSRTDATAGEADLVLRVEPPDMTFRKEVIPALTRRATRTAGGGER